MKQQLLHLVMFLVTLVVTTFAGLEWMFGSFFLWDDEPITWDFFKQGFYFSVPFIGILTCHEFGHYFTARYYKLRVSLPYYIPLWFFGVAPSIGTMGAFIKIKSPLRSTKEFFDVGIAGPLAGFVVAIAVLWYGFANLPEPEYIFLIHPEYAEYGLEYPEHVYGEGNVKLSMGTNLLFEFFKAVVVEDKARIPHPNEIYHYPFLLAGFLACFFTALNLIPIGQLDGGHILYGLVGYNRHRLISPILFALFIFLGGVGMFHFSDFLTASIYFIPSALLYLGFLFLVFQKLAISNAKKIGLVALIFVLQLLAVEIFPALEGFPGWLVFGFILGRVLGVYHPPALFEQRLDRKRQVLGWIALIIFIITFSPAPFIVS